MRTPFAQRLAERTAERLEGSGISRRSLLVRTAVVGSAIVVAPRRFLFEPGTAYASFTDLCGPDNSCGSGYTVFCATINNGLNECPPGTEVAGWWRADGSSWCCNGSRYYIDCNALCTGGCSGSCFDPSNTLICQDSCQSVGCHGCSTTCKGVGNCDQRLYAANRFRYPNCSTQQSCTGDVVCRRVSCTFPTSLPGLGGCNGGIVSIDQETAEHSAPGLQQASWQGGAVAIRPDGYFINAPAVATVRGSSRADVFALRSDGNIWWTSESDSNGGWSGWVSLGRPPAGVNGSPGAVSWSPGRLDVFVRGNSDNKLWQIFSANGGSSWSTWFQPVGADGTLASNPGVVSWAPNRLDVFVVGTDGNVYQRFWDTASWNSAWLFRGRPPVGIAATHPSAASWAPGRMDVFVRGADNKAWQTFYDNGSWSSWVQPLGNAGTATSAIEAASWGAAGSNQLAIFTRGTDGGVYWANYYRGGWSGWARIGIAGNTIEFDPRAASRGCQQLDVVARGTDSLCYRYKYVG